MAETPFDNLFKASHRARARVLQSHRESNVRASRAYTEWAGLFHPTSEEEIIGMLDRITDGLSWRLYPLYAQWYEEILFVLGEQRLEYDIQRRRFQARRQPKHVPRYTTNLILPKVQTAIGELVGLRPVGKVYPNTTRASGIDGAEAANKIRQFKWIDDEMERKRREIAQWLVLNGMAWAKSTIEWQAEDRIPVEIDAPDPDVPGKTLKVTVDLPLRDYDTEVCSPFEIMFDWSRSEYNPKRGWIVHHKIRPIEWVRDNFGSKAASMVTPEDQVGHNAWYQWKIRDLLNRVAGRIGMPFPDTTGQSSGDITLASSCYVKEFYEAPNPDYEQGRVYIVGGSYILHAEDRNWYEQNPFTQYRYIVIPGTPWGMGLVRNAIDPQRRLNGLDSQVALNRKTVNAGCWLVPSGSAFGRGTVSGAPGAIHEYDPAGSFGQKPERIPGTQMGADVWRERETIERNVEEVMLSRGGILQGEKPKGVVAGIAIERLQEQGRQQHLDMKEGFLDSLEQMERFRLRLAQMAPAWKSPRAVKLIGEDGYTKVYSFMAADMNDEVDFRVERSTRRLESHAAQVETLFGLVERGLINVTNPLNQARLLQELGYGEYNEQYSRDYMMAKRKVEAIREGVLRPTPVPGRYDPETRLPEMTVKIGEFDDHEIHLQVAMGETKTQDFEAWPEERKLTLLLYIYAHQIALHEKMLLEPQPGDEGMTGEGFNVEGNGKNKGLGFGGNAPPDPQRNLGHPMMRAARGGQKTGQMGQERGQAAGGVR